MLNKADKLTNQPEELHLDLPDDQKISKIYMSAKHHQGLEQLQQMLVKTAALPEVTAGDVIVTNVRHYEALSHALEAIHRVQEGMEMGISGDFISQDLRECLFHLAEIVGGEITTDEVLGNIFKHFCVGK